MKNIKFSFEKEDPILILLFQGNYFLRFKFSLLTYLNIKTIKSLSCPLLGSYFSSIYKISQIKGNCVLWVTSGFGLITYILCKLWNIHINKTVNITGTLHFSMKLYVWGYYLVVFHPKVSKSSWIYFLS